MLSYYIVSNLRPEYVSQNKLKSFFACQYTGYLHGYSVNEENVAKFPFSSKESLSEAYNFSDLKLRQYTAILSQRLNKLLGQNYSNDFWAKAFSLGLLRQITQVYEHFVINEKYFQPTHMQYEILDESCYLISNTYEDDRQLYQTTFFGQEQLFSIYVNSLFLNLSVKRFILRYENTQKKVINKGVLGLVLDLFHKRSKILRTLKNKIKKNIFFDPRKIKIGILGAFFSPVHLDELVHMSKGGVNYLDISDNKWPSKLQDMNLRADLCRSFEGMDRFDRYFFAVLKYAMPKILLEDFVFASLGAKNALSKFPNLGIIVSEAWLSSTPINLFRAIAYEEKSIPTYYNEHNCIFHPFVGNLVQTEARLVEKYITFGWGGLGENFTRKSSLFEFKVPLQARKKYDILYVSYPAEAKTPFFTSSYSNSGYGAMRHINFAKDFFSLLPFPLLKKISYRGYPRDYFLVGLRYDKENILKPWINHVTPISSLKNSGETCKQQMAQSRIVVIDYLSTAYLESLMMNIPTVAFYDPETMFLAEGYEDFYNPLIEAKILHTSPQSAADHIKNIHYDPAAWWESHKIQKLKNKWLSANLGPASIMKEYLLGLCSDTKAQD